MTTIASTALTNRNSLLRLSVIGGLIIGALHFVIQDWIVFGIWGNKLIPTMQYVASGAIGNAAFAGGIATALLGMLFHFLMCIVIAGIFIVSADRIPLLRRYVIPGSLLYGVGVFLVMWFIVLPLSAAPPLPAPQIFQLIEGFVEHMLLIGLPLGILVQRNANANQ
jgi:magnesium-transporting ATPase (P-type)